MFLEINFDIWEGMFEICKSVALTSCPFHIMSTYEYEYVWDISRNIIISNVYACNFLFNITCIVYLIIFKLPRPILWLNLVEDI